MANKIKPIWIILAVIVGILLINQGQLFSISISKDSVDSSLEYKCDGEVQFRADKIAVNDRDSIFAFSETCGGDLELYRPLEGKGAAWTSKPCTDLGIMGTATKVIGNLPITIRGNPAAIYKDDDGVNPAENAPYFVCAEYKDYGANSNRYFPLALTDEEPDETGGSGSDGSGSDGNGDTGNGSGTTSTGEKWYSKKVFNIGNFEIKMWMLLILIGLIAFVMMRK